LEEKNSIQILWSKIRISFGDSKKAAHFGYLCANFNAIMINLILFGKPGAGKGTQAAFLKKRYELVHISTGDLFRNHIQNKTDLGTLAQSYMDKGDLVPDQVTINMLEQEVAQNPAAKGFIFDGFPRTTAQAQALDGFLRSLNMQISGTLALEADDDLLVGRLLKRGETSGRTDDQDEAKIRNRFEEYNTKTAPLKDYYQAQNKFFTIDGVGEISEITARLEAVVDQLK
jgi:adenylate kinase